MTAIALNGAINNSQSILINIKSIRVDNLTVLSDINTLKIFGFLIANDWNTNLTSVNWTMNTGLTNITANQLTNLVPSENLFVYVQYNYTSAGNFNVNATGINGTTLDYQLTNTIVT